MKDEQTKGEFKVSDKRRIVVDDQGNVVDRGEPEKPAAAAEAKIPEPPQKSGGEASNEEFEKECEPCEDDWRQMPPIDFASFVFSLSTSTMMFLGLLPDPQTKEQHVDLAMAKHHIDILGLLKDKTKGNLNDEEAKFIDQSLYDLRLLFVQACNAEAN